MLKLLPTFELRVKALGFFGSSRFLSYGPVFKFMTTLLIIMLELSGGLQEYERFRIPISVIILIYASLFIDEEFLSSQSTHRKILINLKFFGKKKKS